MDRGFFDEFIRRQSGVTASTVGPPAANQTGLVHVLDTLSLWDRPSLANETSYEVPSLEDVAMHIQMSGWIVAGVFALALAVTCCCLKRLRKKNKVYRRRYEAGFDTIRSNRTAATTFLRPTNDIDSIEEQPLEPVRPLPELPENERNPSFMRDVMDEIRVEVEGPGNEE